VTVGGVATMEPTGTGGQIGTDADRVGANLGAVRVGQNMTFDDFAPRLRPETDETGQVGNDGNAWDQMWAVEFIDAGTGTAINDGGDPLSGLADGHGPPDTCEVCDDETGETKGYSVNQMAREAWDVIREQTRRIEALEARLAALEADADPNA
jgi:hypothetical protein